MVTLGGHSGWLWTFGEPTPAAGWRPGSFGYGGTGDWVCKPELYERYGKWITDFCRRYWKDGHGALWGLENYNEPWEGGGISGWARDMLQYRAVQKLIATAARRVSPDIKILAASSIMNTEDKLYSDGSKEFDQYIDIFTDHYVCRRRATARWWPRPTARSRWRPKPGSSTPSTCCRRAWRSSWPAGSSGSRPGTRACCSIRCPAPTTSTSSLRPSWRPRRP